jgi:hypothetical protein
MKRRAGGKRGAMPEAKYPRYALKRWFADRFETPPSGTPSAGIRHATPTSFACLRGSRPSFAGTGRPRSMTFDPVRENGTRCSAPVDSVVRGTP